MTAAVLDLDVVDPRAAGFDRDALARLNAALSRLIERQRLPGAVVLIVRRGAVASFEALGWQDPSRGVAMRRDSLFRIYSMTKPIASVALMRLVEQGRVMLRDPLSKYVPSFAGTRVAVQDAQGLRLVAPARPITLYDLLRHTAGLTYEFLSPSTAVRRRYVEADLGNRDVDNARHADVLAALPLMHEPGSIWEYSRATDVIGRVIEVAAGEPLGEHLRRALFAPLGMPDSGFVVPAADHERIAEPFPNDPDNGNAVQLFDPRAPAALESAGGGLVSTAADYARFLQMLMGGGRCGGVRVLGPKTVEAMTADHLGAIPQSPGIMPAGHGFGLGFAVMTAAGQHTEPGSVGAYGWSGAGGTSFFVDPQESLFALVLTQAPGLFDEVRELFRQLVYAAIDD
ncbi:MAG TPA: serine hydrolase domain-containing protein [Burkholderiaceae bacterium]|nr:serine hydrolase domain-containing protein [Burkholderiaceae bacterium]